MKKTSLFCLALGLSAALCACGSAATETTPVPETDAAVAATESNDTTGTENAAAETESVVTEDAVPTSYLTGQYQGRNPAGRNRTGIRDL